MSHDLVMQAALYKIIASAISLNILEPSSIDYEILRNAFSTIENNCFMPQLMHTFFNLGWN